jgi:hypothetical protein
LKWKNLKNKHARANHDGGLRKVGILTYNIMCKENHVKGIIDKKLESFVDGEVFFIRVVGGDVKVPTDLTLPDFEFYNSRYDPKIK